MTRELCPNCGAGMWDDGEPTFLQVCPNCELMWEIDFGPGAGIKKINWDELNRRPYE